MPYTKTHLFDVFVFSDLSKAIIEGESCKFARTDTRQRVHECGPSIYYRLPLLSWLASIILRRDKRVAVWLIAVEIIPQIVRITGTLKVTSFIEDRDLQMFTLKLIIEVQILPLLISREN